MDVTRRLAAIFYADVAGYSRLTGADEVGTHRRVMAVLDDVTARIADAGGEVLRYAGDAVLAVFPSIVLAVETASAIQTALAGRDADRPGDERVLIRIGLNLGDVIEDRGEVYGEGVNLAARLEAAAEPGGICLSDDAYRQCRKRLGLAFFDGGEERFRNIDEAVRVWRWSPGVTVTEPDDGEEPAADRKPSIAVLPFTNMSGDAEQEYFSDGITEDIITELSRFRDLLVIARNSSFTYKGQAVDVKEAGARLGASYVVEGSVRKAGNRVRVTAQLIEAASGNHVWAERYDRELEDIFQVQDDVVGAIVAALPGHIHRQAAERSRHRPLQKLSAYDSILRGRWYTLQYRQTASQLAEDAFLHAIELDPGNAIAHGGLATVYIHDYFWTGTKRRLRMSLESAQRAVELDRNEPVALNALSLALAKSGRAEEAVAIARRASELLPGSMELAGMLGVALVHAGRHEEARAHLLRATQLDTELGSWADDFLGQTYYFTHRFDEAAACFERVVEPPSWVCAYHAAACAMQGDDDGARRMVEAAERTLRRESGDALSMRQFVAREIDDMSCYARPDDLALMVEGYRRAGLPA